MKMFEVNAIHHDGCGEIVDQDFMADVGLNEINLYSVLSALKNAGEDVSGIQQASIERSGDEDDGESFALYDGTLMSYTFTEKA